MAPINFEENIREQLEKREIKPSGKAWEQLSTQLDEKQEPKNSKVLWYAIAAALIGVLIAVSIFSNRSRNASDAVESEFVEVNASETAPDVTEDQKNVEVVEATSLDSEERKEKTIASEDITEKILHEKIAEKSPISKNTNPEKILEESKVTSEALVENIPSPMKEKELNVTRQEVETSQDELLNIKINEVVAQVALLQKENTNITAEEIDALLINAQRELRTQQILNSNKVDATALLQDVEQDLERSFRDKVYDALGEGFSKIRTAVIERNN